MNSNKDTKATPRLGPDGQFLFDWTDTTSEEKHRSLPVSASPPLVAPNENDTPDDRKAEPLASNESALQAGFSRSPGHPWYYYREGDNAPPIPFEAIPPSEEAGLALKRDLPKATAKRIVRAHDLLKAERREIEGTRKRYQEVIIRGAKALSRYDREIAYGGNDEMARAGTLALLFNQISWRLGRIAMLEREQSLGGGRWR